MKSKQKDSPNHLGSAFAVSIILVPIIVIYKQQNSQNIHMTEDTQAESQNAVQRFFSNYLNSSRVRAKNLSFMQDREHIYANNTQLKNKVIQLTKLNKMLNTQLTVNRKEKDHIIKMAQQQSRDQTTINRSRKAIVFNVKSARYGQSLSNTSIKKQKQSIAFKKIARDQNIEVEKLKNELKRIKMSIKSTTVNELTAENNQLLNQTERLKDIIAQQTEKYNKTLAAQANQIEQLSNKLNQEKTTKNKSMLQIRRNQRDLTAEKLNQAESKRIELENRLNKQIGQYRREITNLKIELYEQANNLNRQCLNDQCARNLMQKGELQKINQQNQAQIRRLREETQSLNTQILSLNGHIQILNGQTQDLKRQIQGFNGKTQSLRSQIQGLNGQVQNLTAQTQNLTSQKQNLKSQVQNLNILIQQLNTQLINVQNANLRLVQQNAQRENRQRQREAEQKQLKLIRDILIYKFMARNCSYEIFCSSTIIIYPNKLNREDIENLLINEPFILFQDQIQTVFKYLCDRAQLAGEETLSAEEFTQKMKFFIEKTKQIKKQEHMNHILHLSHIIRSDENGQKRIRTRCAQIDKGDGLISLGQFKQIMSIFNMEERLLQAAVAQIAYVSQDLNKLDYKFFLQRFTNEQI